MAVLTSRCVQFTYGDKREVYLLDENALPVTKKEGMRKGKKSLGPRIKFSTGILSFLVTGRALSSYRYTSLLSPKVNCMHRDVI